MQSSRTMQDNYKTHLEAARRFAADSPTQEHRVLLEQYISDAQKGDAEARRHITQSFSSHLNFGTAGLRAPMGPGTSRLNHVTVAQAAYAIASALLELKADARSEGVVLGFDGRKHSHSFAEEVVAVFTGMGFRVHHFLSPVPTPLVAFATRDCDCISGIMITASHNPPEYNGIKVFDRDGSQIIAPLDMRIAELLARAPSYRLLERVEADDERREQLATPLGDACIEAYMKTLRDQLAPSTETTGVLSLTGKSDRFDDGLATPSVADSPPFLATQPPDERARGTLRVAYSAMQGVGFPFVKQAVDMLEEVDLLPLPSQRDPDPDFKAVASPNPEHEHALAELLDFAEAQGATLAIANDPDADRLAVAFRETVADKASADIKGKTGQQRPDQAPHAWRVLNGNEIGCLMADELLRQRPRPVNPFVLSTIVSAPVLQEIASFYGAHWEPTLTGFKWIAHRAKHLEHEGKHFVFAYEEAIGFLGGRHILDKDGICAALQVCALAKQLATQGKTLGHRLWELRTRHGYFHSDQLTLKRNEQERSALDSLRQNPPTRLGETQVEDFWDFLKPETVPFELPEADILGLKLSGGHRIMLRASGTEPKLKVYFDVNLPVPLEGPEVETQLKHEAQQLVEALASGIRAYLK